MSSRVQKGGPVFRPVVKSRSRTVPSTSRQPSVSAVGAESQNNNATEYNASSITPSISQPAVEPSGYPSTHPKGLIMVDRSNSIPIVNATSSRISLRPPLIVSSSSKNYISPPSSLPLVVETRDLQASILSNSSVPISTIDSTVDSNSTVSIHPGVDLQRNQSTVEMTVVRSANVAASTLTASLTTLPSNEEEAPDASTSLKRSGKCQSKILKGTKKRNASNEDDDDETTRDGSLPSKQRRTRASSSTPRPRKRVPSPPPYDPNADPGEDIDPTSVTMATLCTDTGQGRVSRKAAEILTNHAAWKAKSREKRAHMRALMELKKYGREDEESEHDQDGAQSQPVEAAASTSTLGTTNPPVTAPMLDDTGSGFDYSQGLATSRYNVQVRIGPNGETVIDEDSLVVDRVENDGTDGYTHVIESDHTKFINSGTYGKRYRGSRWSAEETELFYHYGENYELIAYVLPGRDRKSCKNKFKAEDKRNHIRIDHCLNNSIPVDMKTLARMTGKDFSGPVPEIRVPSHPIATVAPSQEDTDSQTDVAARQHVKKRSRSKSQSGVENGVVVIGDADTFQN
ncbi:hypothetical protein BYT27DRAFT_7256359 [Phlegmacium glaucopus]|nr:hypothetical protein BYT27DRAFT_7256359 [Phlegmacium glaucopus]